ncbi:translation factor GTPase family protein [Priestia megaterium]
MKQSNKTIGIAAHVDTGKTTFSEQLLYHTKSIKQRGRVDHKDSFLDTHTIEKERGITVFADQGTFSYNGSTYYLIDTPGHVDFSPEMERSIQVMDYAIIILSAVEGVEGHTETVWQLLQKHRVPVFFFINKIDRVGADPERVINDIKHNLTPDVFDITSELIDGSLSEELIEFIAEKDEELLDAFMKGKNAQAYWRAAMQKLIQTNQLFPCASGSALQDFGIKEFLEKVDLLTETRYSQEEAFSGRVYKIRHDGNGMRITFIKALSGKLQVRDEVAYEKKGDLYEEKITQIRAYNGSTFKNVNEGSAGELFAVTGLSSASIGDGLGTLKESRSYELLPTLKSKVVFEPSVHPKEGIKIFQLLDAEDPSLHVTWEERTQELHIHVMGAIQLEVLEKLIKERFNINVQFEEPEILYKESIQNTVMGYGHFEPLKHYAEVHLKIEAAERNSGITFENACHAEDLSVGYQNLVRQHIFEKPHHGLLTGSPITDIKVTLCTGRAHNKHTSGGDFREATYRALRQGLEKTENIVLEPYYDFKIKVDIDQMGRVLADVQSAHGRFDSPVTTENKAIITGKVPVATFMTYGSTLASFTHGKGAMSLLFGGYERCHNEEEVIEQIRYNKEADPEYSSSSVFCAKGQGYTVPWKEAEEKMHCL